MVSENRRMIRSYEHLRKAVGVIGIALPFVLLLGVCILFNQESLPTSISRYYFTGMRDVFVGALCAISLFMFFYAGYEKYDDVAANFAGFFALGVAWFPTTSDGAITWISAVHFSSAVLLFIDFAIFSMFLFTKTSSNGGVTPRKKIRNIIYIICGATIFSCIIAMVIFIFFFKKQNPGSHFVYWIETLALISFGSSWLIKGGAIIKDKS